MLLLVAGRDGLNQLNLHLFFTMNLQPSDFWLHCSAVTLALTNQFLQAFSDTRSPSHNMYHWQPRAEVTPPPPCWLGIHTAGAPAPRWPPTLACSGVPDQRIHKEICSSFYFHVICIMQNRTMKTFKWQIRLIFQNIIWYEDTYLTLMSGVVVDVAAPFPPRAASSPLYF